VEEDDDDDLFTVDAFSDDNVPTKRIWLKDNTELERITAVLYQ
jgi:hypothetical protein